MSLLVTRMVTRPDLMVLKMEIASECDMPWTDIPLTERISSPEKINMKNILLKINDLIPSYNIDIHEHE